MRGSTLLLHALRPRSLARLLLRTSWSEKGTQREATHSHIPAPKRPSPVPDYRPSTNRRLADTLDRLLLFIIAGLVVQLVSLPVSMLLVNGPALLPAMSFCVSVV